MKDLIIHAPADGTDEEQLQGLSVIIPVAEDPEGLAITLGALTRGLDREAVQVIVCNDGAHESVRAVCKRFAVETVEITPNRGSYYARNRGLEIARHEWIGFLDANVVPCPGWSSLMREALRHHAYVGGDIRPPEPAPHNWTQLHQWYYAFPVAGMMRERGFAPTANLAVRRAIFRQVGTFDERMRSGGDYGFGRRVREAGNIAQVYAGDIYVVHPFRTLREMIFKQLRVIIGARDFARLNPGQAMLLPLKNQLRQILPVMTVKRLLGARPLGGRGYPLSFRQRLGPVLIEYLLAWVSLYARFCRNRGADDWEWDKDGRQRTGKR